MFGIGMPEMIVILVIALIVIGPSRLPEIARSIGKGYAELTRSMRTVQQDFEDMTSGYEEERQMLKDPLETLSKTVENALTEDESPNDRTSSDKTAPSGADDKSV